MPIPIAHAAGSAEAFERAIDPIIAHVVNLIVMLMFAVAILVFAYGALEMIWKGSDDEARKKGRAHMLYGVIGMAIMVSAWGIISLVSNTIGQF